ncbi:hypothetical protein OCL06_07415 [Alteromonas sp. ASW11-19]|uniref:Uncharacterized protein n=1 Tax=Alteromonas salexigens TaxID=2982530 RepID=A0ABT2VM80_9ALTE|nr:hypothetical protein [Alteromonas salexigens]MCU7554422.1 hypothetical protein [Alteromonas salexigens]
MDKTDFLALCHKRIVVVYQATKAGTPDDAARHRMEGFMNAGQVIGVVTQAEVRELIERAHYQVFGETVAERKERKASLESLKESEPDRYYAIPAIERR